MKDTTIAVIFDFDDTLAPDATSALLAKRGVPLDAFWNDVKELYQSGWDPVPAYLFKLLEESRNNSEQGPITRGGLQQGGQSVSFFPGVESLFERLRAFVAAECVGVSLEFYLISSGIAELLKATPIAGQFKNVWACDFHYNEREEISYPKNIVSFTDKTRYIFQIAKGIVGADAHGQPFAVNKAVSHEMLRIPFSHMVFVGDGYTDIPCFSLVRSKGGVAFGVYDPTRRSTWAKAWDYVAENRVSNLVPADYSESGALWHNLQMAIEKVAGDISLQTRAYQG